MKKIILVCMVFIAGCSSRAQEVAAPRPLSPQEAGQIVIDATNTAAAFATSDAQATRAVMATANVMATQAQSTLDAGQRNAIIMVTQAAARQTLDAASISPTQTIQAVVVAQTQSAQAVIQANHARDVENYWTIFAMVIGGALTLAICGVIVWIGRAYAGKTKSQAASHTFELISDEHGVPRAYRTFNPSSGIWTVYPLNLGLPPGPVEQATLPNPNNEAREKWGTFVKDVARGASLISSWSINDLSTRKGGAGVATEDMIEAARNIAVEIGALVNYGGNRGFDWATGWGMIELGAEIDAGRAFTLPHRPDGSLLLPPQADISRCNARQRNTATGQGGRK